MGTGDSADKDIPHGHGLSHRKGMADGLLGAKEHEDSCPPTHRASYFRGYTEGERLAQEVMARVKS